MILNQPDQRNCRQSIIIAKRQQQTAFQKSSIIMNQPSHEQGSSLLDQDEQSISSVPKANTDRTYQQPVSTNALPIQIDFKCLLKTTLATGIIVFILVVYLIIQLQNNPLTLIKQSQSEQYSYNGASQQPDFVIEFKQKPIPSSPSQRPPSQPRSQPGFNPWLQVQTQSGITDKYFFKIPIERMIQLSDPQLFFGKGYQEHMQGLTMEQLEFGLNMMYVTHNVDYKGEVQVEMAAYDYDKDKKAQRIKQLLSAQEKIYEQKYQYKQYLKQQLPFCIISPSYNNVNTKLYLRYLDSLFMQNYDNFHIVYIDDASPDRTGQQVKKYVNSKRFPQNKIQVIINKQNVFALENIYNAIHYHCNAGEIVMLVDGDDALIGRQVFGVFNAVYQRTESALVYSSYLHIMFNQKALVGASSKPIPMALIQRHDGVRKQHSFFTSHLLTFYVDLFRKIKKQDLTYDNGTFFRYAYDVAMCTPMLEMIGDRFFYLPELTYEYRYDTGQNDPGSGQQEVTEIVSNKQVYDKLDLLPFIDDRENYLKIAEKRSAKK